MYRERSKVGATAESLRRHQEPTDPNIGREARPSRGAGRGASMPALVALSAAAAFLLIGCGHSSSEQASGAGAGSSGPADQTTAAVPASMPGEVATPQGVVTPPATAEAPAPDVVAFLADTLARPGEAVEITAQASDDVTDIELSDGLGGSQSFACDPATKEWRVFYRYPLKSAKERQGLSVTARTSAGRWRRVWVFLSPRTENAPAATDSLSEK